MQLPEQVARGRRELDADVLIGGGGPVGTGLAIDLALRGVSSIVVEQNLEIQSVPKGQNLTQRTGEHFLAWGVADRIRKAAPIPPAFGSAGLTAYGSLFSGYHFDWFKRASVREFYFADNERLPQYGTEEVLRRRLEELAPSSLLTGWRLEAVRQRDFGVELTAAGAAGGELRLRGEYLVGCDGSNSTVRELAGICSSVEDHARRMVLLVFRSSTLNRLVSRFERKSFFHIINPELDGYWQFLGRVDLDGTWFYHSPVDPGTTADSFDFAAHLQRAIGAEFEISLVHIGFWDLRFAVAESWRRERVFIAGDAAHSHPPYGGFGINLGFEDARNLGWKLAASTAGWAGAGLLDSYTDERKAVFDSTAEHFIRRLILDDRELIAAVDPARDRPAFERAWHRKASGEDVDVSAYVPHYCGSPIVAGNPDAASGARGVHSHAPGAGLHLSPKVLANGADPSTVLGSGFALIATGLDQTDRRQFASEAQDRGIPLRIVDCDRQQGVDGSDAEIILVRPDHFIAYASAELPASIGPILKRAAGH